MPLARLIFYLLLLHTILISLTGLTWSDRSTTLLRSDLIPAEEQCRLPCWQGLRPSATGYSQAVNLLNQHPWIKQVRTNTYDGFAGWIELAWTPNRPIWILESDGDGLRIDQTLVERISLHTALTPADLWLVLGPPNWTRQYSSPPTQYLVHGWQRLGLSATMEIPCDYSLDAFWRTPVNLTWVMFLPPTGNARSHPPVELLECKPLSR